MSAQECPSPSLQVTIICRKSADETTEISRSSTQRRTGTDSEFSGRVSSSPAACVLLWRRRRRGVGRHRMNSHRSHAGERDNGPRQDNAVALWKAVEVETEEENAVWWGCHMVSPACGRSVDVMVGGKRMRLQQGYGESFFKARCIYLFSMLGVK